MSYQKIIADAIGVNDPKILAEVEDTMRHTIFHSTLDWQSAEELREGARKAYGIRRVMKRGKSKLVLPEDAEIAKLFGLEPQDIRCLAADLS